MKIIVCFLSVIYISFQSVDSGYSASSRWGQQSDAAASRYGQASSAGEVQVRSILMYTVVKVCLRNSL